MDMLAAAAERRAAEVRHRDTVGFYTIHGESEACVDSQEHTTRGV